MEGNILANKTATDRPQTDFYPTPVEVTVALMQFLNIPTGSRVWEPACGEGHMSKAIMEMGYAVASSDINDFGFGEPGIDYLTCEKRGCDWIITNPPFKESESFIKRSIEHQVRFALLLKSQYWHSKRRMELFNQYKPRYVLPLTWRPDFLFGKKGGAPTMECIWTVWGSQPAAVTEYIPLQKPVI